MAGQSFEACAQRHVEVWLVWLAKAVQSPASKRMTMDPPRRAARSAAGALRSLRSSRAPGQACTHTPQSSKRSQSALRLVVTSQSEAGCLLHFLLSRVPCIEHLIITMRVLSSQFCFMQRWQLSSSVHWTGSSERLQRLPASRHHITSRAD